MKLSVDIAGNTYAVNLNAPKTLAIELRFNEQQPSFFGAPEARSQPLQAGDFVGDTQRGASCNVAELRMVPHCNGTHTETVGHIVHTHHATHASLPQSLMPAVVLSVTAVDASETGDDYSPAPDRDDKLITRQSIQTKLVGYPNEALTALIVRTLPNDAAKKTTEYGEHCQPPFFSADAIRYVAERGVEHLLTDIASIDEMHDGGRLTNHHIFWNVPDGSHDATSDTQFTRTITEMIYADDSIVDGLYLLNLQLPAFHSDAAPSRPVLYDLQPE
jgi:kynurenine formamidase